ncbi:MAG: hypothetical protein QXK93_07500 [Candidatus Bathyarchaeia archaeon]
MSKPIPCNFDCSNCHIGSRGGKFHQEVLKKICFLGRKSGLHTASEWAPPAYSGGVQPEEDEYTPLIDLVWFIDLFEIMGESSFYKLCSIVSSWTNGKITPDNLRFIPYAAFEVEVSDPTSKTIYSDLHNLAATRSALKFEVIREIGDMNLNRAERIKESAMRFCGATDMFVLTTQMLEEIFETQSYVLTRCSLSERKTSKLDDIQKKLMTLAAELNLNGKVEFTPPECLGLRNVYVPRLDAALLIPVPKLASDLISTIGKKYSLKMVRDLCHLTLFGFEYEKETSQKHIAGGVANLSRHSHIGFLVTPSEKTATAKRIVNKYSIAFGFNNVFVLDKDII